MKKVSNEFINLSKKVKTQDIKLTINNGELTVQEVHFMPVNIFNSIPISRLKTRKEVIAKELKYSFEGQLFKTIMQQVEITVKNASEIKGKKIDFKYGILINNEFEYLDMGEYYIKDVEDDKNKEELVVTGYDKMLNFMIPFKQSDLKLTYPCKMGQLVSRMGEVCGVELYSADFYSSDLIVDEDFFTIQELTYRDVLEKIAQTTLTTIFIKENKLYLCKIGESVQTLDTSFLSNLVIGEKFGPVNALVLGRGSVEDNIESVDQKSINTNGRCEIRFDENEFVDSKREEVIDEMFQQINGLEYYAIEASNLGILWLDPCDVIIAKDREESEYKTIYLKASVTINTGIKGEIEADIPEETTTEYKVTTKEEKKTLKVERLARKNEGLIQDIVKEVGDRTEKETSVTQDIDSITSRVYKLEEFTKTKIETNQINLEETPKGEGYIVELKVKGNSEKIKYLTPSNTLTPSNSLVPSGGHFTIICDKQSRTSMSNEAVEIDVILNNPLRNLGDVYDELNIIDGKTTVTRRIGVNNDGSLYVLSKSVTETLQDVKLATFEDDTYVYIKEFTGLEYTAKYIVKNEYSDKFITKLEANTKIEQKAESIIETAEKSYATKGELVKEKSERIQTSQLISEEVSKKVGEEELGTKIEQNWEHIKYAWNQISQYIQLEGSNGLASLNIYDENNKLLMTLNQDGTYYYYKNNSVGNIGTTYTDEDENARCLTFNLDNCAKGSMVWAYQENEGDTGYNIVLGYWVVTDNLKLGKDLDTNGHNVFLGYDKKIAIKNNDIINTSNDNVILRFGTNEVLNCYNNLDMQGWKINNANNLITTYSISEIDMPYYASDRSYIGLDFTTKNDGTFRVQINTSDGRLKNNIADSEINALDTIEKIQHRQFNWKDSNRFQELGYIAQEMEEINENFVTKVEQTNENGDVIDYLYQISDKDIIPYVTKAIQELNDKQKEYIDIIEKQQKIIDLLVEKAGIDVSSINSNKKMKSKSKNINQIFMYDKDIKFSKCKIIKNKEIKNNFTPEKIIIDMKKEKNEGGKKWTR